MAHIKTGDVWDTLSGRVYFGEAPQNADFPYVVFTIVDIAHSMTIGSTPKDFDTARIDFEVFSDTRGSLIESESILNELAVLMDDASLTFVDTGGTNYTAVGCVRDIVRGPIKDEEVWQTGVDYLVTYQES